jgi:hypothetical protein
MAALCLTFDLHNQNRTFFTKVTVTYIDANKRSDKFHIFHIFHILLVTCDISGRYDVISVITLTSGQ